MAAMAVAMVEVVKAAGTGEVVRVVETVAAEKGGAREVAAMAVATVEEVKLAATVEVVKVAATVVEARAATTGTTCASSR